MGVTIQGRRLVLRAFQPDEVDAEWERLRAADPISVATVPDETRFRTRLARSGHMVDGWLDLAIDLDGAAIGRIQTFVPPDRELPPGTYDIGIGLHAPARGQGYGTEALALLAGWLFEHAGAEVIEGATDPANGPMRAVLAHSGWTEEGPVTELGREWVLYTLTRQQWQVT